MSKRPRVDKTDDATKAIGSAQEGMSTVCKRLSESAKQEQPHNETRAFCEMLYHQLLKFNEDDREQIQFELQQVVMHQHHRRRHYTSVSTSASSRCFETPATVAHPAAFNQSANRSLADSSLPYAVDLTYRQLLDNALVGNDESYIRLLIITMTERIMYSKKHPEYIKQTRKTNNN